MNKELEAFEEIKNFAYLNDWDELVYLKDRIYFRSGINFNYYGKNGVRKILSNTELEFNSDISLGAYAK